MELMLLEWLDTETVCALLLLEDMVWIGEVPLDTDILKIIRYQVVSLLL